jgi:hypothetical protein
MTRREIAALACKVLALWLMAQAAIPLLDVVAQCVWLIFTWNLDRLSGPSALAVIAATGVTFLVSGGVGLFLWLRASSLASRMASDDATPVARPAITSQDMMSLAFVVVGVVTLVTAARDMVGCVARTTPRGATTLRSGLACAKTPASGRRSWAFVCRSG